MNETLNWLMSPVSIPLVLIVSIVLMNLIGYYQYMITYPLRWCIICLTTFMLSVIVCLVMYVKVNIMDQYDPQIYEGWNQLWEDTK